MLLVVMFFFFNKTKKPKFDPNQINVTKKQDDKILIFHPDSVLKVKIEQNSIKHEFTRKNNLSPWQLSNSTNVQELLNEISFYSGTNMPEIDDHTNELEIEFIDGQKWQAEWDKEIFVWNEGPYKGRGVKIAATSSLRMGKFFEHNKSLQLCPSRLKSIKFSDSKNQLEWSITQQKLDWRLSKTLNKKTSTIAIDPNFIELWLGQHCDLELEQLQDLASMNDLEEPTCTIQFTFEKSQKNISCIEVGNEKTLLFKDENSLFQSKELRDALTMMQNAPFGIENKK
jgi:hypothetical protein